MATAWPNTVLVSTLKTLDVGITDGDKFKYQELADQILEKVSEFGKEKNLDKAMTEFPSIPTTFRAVIHIRDTVFGSANNFGEHANIFLKMTDEVRKKQHWIKIFLFP
jgi:hypothetical protein